MNRSLRRLVHHVVAHPLLGIAEALAQLADQLEEWAEGFHDRITTP